MGEKQRFINPHEADRVNPQEMTIIKKKTVQ